MLGIWVFIEMFRVQALVGELRACRPLSERKKEKEKRTEKAITSGPCPGPPRYSRNLTLTFVFLRDGGIARGVLA